MAGANIFSDEAVEEIRHVVRAEANRMQNTRGHRGRWGGNTSRAVLGTIGGNIWLPNYSFGTDTTVELLAWTSDEISLWSGNLWVSHKFDTSTPPSVGTSGLSADTTYDCYAFWDRDNSAVDLELNTTTTATKNGVIVKSGDDTRRWMGIVRTNGSTQFEDSADKRFILNAYNRTTKPLAATVNTGGSSDTNPIEIANANLYNNWHIDIAYHSRITNTAVTGMPIASLNENNGTANSDVAKAYGLTLTETGTDIVTAYDIGLSLSYSERLERSTSGSSNKTTYKVTHSGGTITIQAGTFQGKLIA